MSYLFILCIEMLAIKMRSDPGVKGNLRHLLDIYVDDPTVFLKPNDTNFQNTIQLLNSFYKLSGLKISVTKTSAVWFGSECASNIQLSPDLKINWSKIFTLLGINFDNKLENMQSNFNDKLDKIEKLLSKWSIDI